METKNDYELAQQSLNTLTNIHGKDCVILSKEVAQHISKLLELQNIPSENTIEQITTMIPKLSKEEVQARRDEVREMAFKGKPKDGILLYRGRRGGDVEAVSFFRENYSRYIESGQEVIFAPELAAIDPSLLASLRNECRSTVNPMPIGTVEDRTNARIEKRFFDGARTERSTKVAAYRRRTK
ncbi:hypothetical protein KBD33_04650 [Candidatus Gracilibacteria bacterium]|nr:hypothetical protein [Candidatus Gracilibacteria bacterium]